MDATGGDADGGSTAPSISASGRFVAFESQAADLVPGDTGGISDVFVRDAEASTTTRMSVDALGGGADAGSFVPAISADGRHVAFESVATDLVTGDGNGTYDVFVRDRQAGTTVRASVDADHGDADGASFLPAVSGDGRFVVFYSYAGDLVPADGNGTVDVFRWDRASGASTRVSRDATGGDADGPSFDPVVSDDGRYVSFTSVASDLVTGDGNGLYDVFVRDVLTGSTSRASVDQTGIDANGRSLGPALSGDGRRLAFASYASDLVADDGNHLPDVFLRVR